MLKAATLRSMSFVHRVTALSTVKKFAPPAKITGEPIMLLIHLAYGLLVGYIVFRLAPKAWQGE